MSKKPKGFGFCPKCGSDKLYKSGVTTNHTSKTRYCCSDCGFRTTSPLATPRPAIVPMRKTLPRVKRYIITAAQNATPIHLPTWQTILHAVKYYNAELVVIPGRYKNPTSQWTQTNKDHEWWDAAVLPYLCKGNIALNDRLMILGHTKVQWAAGQPLARMNIITKDKSGIVGHPNRALRSIATPQHKHPKIMMTTAACTVQNYTDTKNGDIAAAHHSLGALIVEIDGDAFYARQLSATKNGDFIDLDVEFTPEGVRPAPRALSISMGDTHQWFIHPQVVKATFDAPNSMVKLLKPQHLIWHDVIDFYSRNHHHDDDGIVGYGKWKFGRESVQKEIEDAIGFVNKKTPKDCESEVVPSNHDQAVLKWLKKGDFWDDPVNLEFKLKAALHLLGTVDWGAGGVEFDDPFISYGETLAAPNVKFLKDGESFVLKEVEYILHGHKGPNGARGTTQNLSTIGVKVTKGHDHTAAIINGCYSGGKSTGMLRYEIGGASSHSNSHVVQYGNGKRAIIIIINGRYCLPRPKLKAKNKKKSHTD